MRQRQLLRQRLRSGEPLIGTFVKIPHPQIVELLAGTALDFIILDAEHAPFSAAVLDQCLMAARLSGLPALVRVPALDKAAMGAALDMGAAGVVVPHIASAEAAEAAVRAALYVGGERGISGSHRAASYGRTDLADYARQADEEIVIVAQIEDAAALKTIDKVTGVDRIDCFFIGRADLMLSLGETAIDAPNVERAIQQLSDAILAKGKTLGTFLGNAAQIGDQIGQGYRLLAVGSDQAMLRAGAGVLVTPVQL